MEKTNYTFYVCVGDDYKEIIIGQMFCERPKATLLWKQMIKETFKQDVVAYGYRVTYPKPEQS